MTMLLLLMISMFSVGATQTGDVLTTLNDLKSTLQSLSASISNIQSKQGAHETLLNSLQQQLNQQSNGAQTRHTETASSLGELKKAITDIDAKQRSNEQLLNNFERQIDELKLAGKTWNTATTTSLNELKSSSRSLGEEQKKITEKVEALTINSQICCSKVTDALALLTQPSTTPELTTPVTKTPPTTTPKPYITDCSVHARSGAVKNGVYNINVHGLVETKAWCNNGYTVIQRRKFGDTRFDKTWAEYSEGFGKPESDHWMGLKHQHILTRDRSCQLQVNIVVDTKSPNNVGNCRSYGWHDCNSQMRHVTGDDFRVSSAFDKFRIRIKYNSTDFIHPTIKSHFTTYFNGNMFTTKDKDVDKHSSINCASHYGVESGGFWYYSCHPGMPNTRRRSTYCSSTNKICGTWDPYFIESSMLQFQCV